MDEHELLTLSDGVNEAHDRHRAEVHLGIDKYFKNLNRMMVMDENSSTTDGDEIAYRERATALLDEFAQQARSVLREAGIGIDLIFLVPPSGDVILTFGTAAELYSREWQTLRTTVSPLVRRSIGLEPAHCRDVVCAMAHAGDYPV